MLKTCLNRLLISIRHLYLSGVWLCVDLSTNFEKTSCLLKRFTSSNSINCSRFKSPELEKILMSFVNWGYRFGFGNHLILECVSNILGEVG